jgi:hypothetical protein
LNGGAIVAAYSKVTITGTTFDQNKGVYGGAIFLLYDADADSTANDLILGSSPPAYGSAANFDVGV